MPRSITNIAISPMNRSKLKEIKLSRAISIFIRKLFYIYKESDFLPESSLDLG